MDALFENDAEAAAFAMGAGAGKARAKKPAGTFWSDGSNDWSEEDLPRREWIAQGYLLRRTLSVMVGMPGVSKSTLALAWGIALALGASFHRLHPIHDSEEDGARKRILIVNTEDDGDEQKRRISALLRQFGRRPRELDGWLMRAGPDHVATLVEKDASTGAVEVSKGFKALEVIIKEFKPDVLVLDPLVELIGGIDENSNGDMSAALSELRALAVTHRMAILLVHHTRKGTVAPGDMDAARGASSLHGKVRQGLTVVGMSEEEATAMGIPLDARRHYLRLDDGKASYAPLGDAQWFERLSIELQNGDTAPTLLPWQAPVDTITSEMRSAIENGITRGIGGEPWSHTFSPKERSIKHLMVQHNVTTGSGQRKLLADLITAGFEKAEFINLKRQKAFGLRSPDGKPANVKWTDEEGKD